MKHLASTLDNEHFIVDRRDDDYDDDERVQ